MVTTTLDKLVDYYHASLAYPFPRRSETWFISVLVAASETDWTLVFPPDSLNEDNISSISETLKIGRGLWKELRVIDQHFLRDRNMKDFKAIFPKESESQLATI